jgi:inner membrane protein
MATPLGHGILGIAAGRFGMRWVGDVDWRWYLFAAVAANAADLDFVPGLFVGDLNRFHHQISHSILAALVFGLLASLTLWRFTATPARVGVVGAGLYGTHLLLDCVTYDGRLPHGMPLLWPFSDAYYAAPFTLFGGVKHGVPGDGSLAVFAQMLSWQNLRIMGIEVLVLLPVAVLLWSLGGAGGRARSGRGWWAGRSTDPGARGTG